MVRTLLARCLARDRKQRMRDIGKEFEQRTGTAWLAFWGQVLQVPSLKRVQSVYQRRTLSNLRSSLKQLVPPDEARRLAEMIAAMIDGVWLRAALSGWREADSESARALLTAFVDGRLAPAAPSTSGATPVYPASVTFASGVDAATQDSIVAGAGATETGAIPVLRMRSILLPPSSATATARPRRRSRRVC